MVVITTTMATTLKIQDAITEVVRIVEVIGFQHQEMVQAIEMLTSMLLNDTTPNNSLVTLLDTHRRVQQETTQALSKIIELQDTKANDVYVNDLPKFSGEPQQFLDWILKVEKIAQLTG